MSGSGKRIGENLKRVATANSALVDIATTLTTLADNATEPGARETLRLQIEKLLDSADEISDAITATASLKASRGDSIA